jgi:hypothetical protein
MMVMERGIVLAILPKNAQGERGIVLVIPLEKIKVGAGIAPEGNTVSAHFKTRMEERFGITLSWEEINSIKNKIENGEAKFVRQESASVDLYRLNFWRQEITVVYNHKKKILITVLPERDIRCKVTYQGDKCDKKEVAMALMGAWVK